MKTTTRKAQTKPKTKTTGSTKRKPAAGPKPTNDSAKFKALAADFQAEHPRDQGPQWRLTQGPTGKPVAQVKVEGAVLTVDLPKWADSPDAIHDNTEELASFVDYSVAQDSLRRCVDLNGVRQALLDRIDLVCLMVDKELSRRAELESAKLVEAVGVASNSFTATAADHHAMIAEAARSTMELADLQRLVRHLRSDLPKNLLLSK